MARTFSCSCPSTQPNAATSSPADACSFSSSAIDAPTFSARVFFPYQGLVPVPAWCLREFSWASPRGFAARNRKHSRQLKGLWLKRKGGRSCAEIQLLQQRRRRVPRKGGGSCAEIQLLQQRRRRVPRTDGGHRAEIQLLQQPMRRAAKTDGGSRREIQLLQQLRLRVPRADGGNRRVIQQLQQPMRRAAKTDGGNRREIQLLQQPRPIAQRRGAQFCQSSRMRNLKFHTPRT